MKSGPRILDIANTDHAALNFLAVPVDPPHAVREEVQRRVVGVDDVEDAGPAAHAFS